MQFLTGRVSVLAWASVMVVSTGSASASKLSEATPSDSIPAGLRHAVLAAIQRDAFDTEVKLTASDAAISDYFGRSVSISGDMAIVGAWGNDDACPGDPDCNSGSAYIIQRDEGGADNWGEVTKLTASDAAHQDEFGHSVAINGDTAIVGAWSNDDAGDRSGSVYIFQRDEGGVDNWGQVTKLTASDAAAEDRFGRSLVISGDTAIVGAVGNDDACPADPDCYSGSAYIFQRDEGGPDNWGEVKKLTASDAAAGDAFGVSVALSGDTAIVGATGNDDAGSQSGLAYIFQRDEGGPENWGEVKKLTASDAAAEDRFGRSLVISGDTAIVGARGNDDAGNASGSAYIFQRDEGGSDNWAEVKKLTASDAAAGDNFGFSTAINGDTAMVGAYANDDAGSFSGSAYIFQRDQGGLNNWGEVQKLTASDAAPGDFFGVSVSTSGDTAIVGAWGNDDAGSNSGSAYVFLSSECGNGVIEGSEECDDGGESATCDTDCTGAECGDGTLNVTAGEECDDGPNNSDSDPDACRTDCVAAHCCDGVVDTGEECDTGVEKSDTEPDACRTSCVEPWCGDGVVDPAYGEECDPAEPTHGALCSQECAFDRGACCYVTAGVCEDSVLEDECPVEGRTEAQWHRGNLCLEIDCEKVIIPTVSQWSMIVLTLLLLTGIMIKFARRRSEPETRP